MEECHLSPIALSHIKRDHNRGGREGKAKSDWLLNGTLQVITSFDAARLETTSTAVNSNTDVELLCTYN